MSAYLVPFGFAKPIVIMPQERRVRAEEQAEEPHDDDPARREQG